MTTISSNAQNTLTAIFQSNEGQRTGGTGKPLERLLTPPTKAGKEQSANLSSTTETLASVMTSEDQAAEDFALGNMPKLSEPAKKTGSNKFNEILAKIMALMIKDEKDQVENFTKNMELFASMREEFTKKMREALDALNAQIGDAMSELEGANDALQGLVGQASSLQQKMESLRAALQKMKDDGVSPDSPEYQSLAGELSAAEQDFVALENKLVNAKQIVIELNNKVLALQEKFSGKIDEATSTDNRFRTAMMNQNAMAEKVQDQGRITNRIIYLLTKIQADGAKDALERAEQLKAHQEFRTERMLAQQAEKVKKQEEEIHKAQQAAKVSNCISKIIGWVVTAVSVALTPFTGGASLALTALSVALMASDEIVKATTGKSFMAEALSPLMNNVIMPLIQAIGKVFDFMMEVSGLAGLLKSISPTLYDAVKMGHTIMTTIAVVVAAAFLAKNAAQYVGKMLKPLMKPVMKMMEKLSKKVHVAGYEKFARSAAVAVMAAQTAGVGVNAYGQINLANADLKYTQFQNQNMKFEADTKLLSDMEAALQESLNKLQEFMLQLMEKIKSIMSHEHQINTSLVNNFSLNAVVRA